MCGRSQFDPYMSDEICAFCLGSATEVPPFGTLKDAQDMLCPCSTCKLVTHRKCLVDWFNSISFSQISRSYTPSLGTDGLQTPVSGPAMQTTDTDTQRWEPEVDGDEQNVFDVSFRSRWFTVLGQYNAEVSSSENSPNTQETLDEEPLFDSGRVLLSTPCPQCKSKITFQVKNPPLLTLNKVLRKTISDTVKYSGILVGLTGAATGIVTMGYVGLARCGVSIIDAIVPVSLIAPLFKRNSLTMASSQLQSLLQLLSGLPGINNSSLLVQQLKFQHIPLLPAMLYQMRFLLILDCFFRKNPTALLTDWIGELLLCNYVSSLGNHTLINQVFKNFKTFVARSWASKSTVTQLGFLLRGIDWWDPAVMVGATIPARWLYDFIYRFSVNRLHFDLNASVRPRETANSLDPSQLSKLENLESQIAGIKYCIHQRLKNTRGKKQSKPSYLDLLKELFSLVRDNTVPRYIHLKVIYWLHKLKACMQHDYSSTLLYRLAIVTGVTTVMWPFVSADLGKLIYGLFILKLSSLAHVEKDKLMFLSNLLAMALVALSKDLVNLYLCHQKARQLNELTVVTQQENRLVTRPSRVDHTARFPGAYEP